MKLLYNQVDLGQLGLLQLVGQTSAAEPPDAPQRQKVTLRWQLHLREQSYLDNQGLVQQLQAALSTQQAVLQWQDGAVNYVNRTVTAGDWEQANPADGVWGTYYMVLTFAFSYYDNDVTGNCLGATWQGTEASNAPALGLGAVLAWTEEYAATYMDPLKKGRKLVQGKVTASGRYQGETTQDLDTVRTGLLARKDQMLAQLAQNAEGQFQYGSFAQKVRVEHFKAAVDQPMNHIDWSVAAFFTRYPNEADYSLVEFKFGQKIILSEGITHLTLAGKIAAPTALAARAKLAALQEAYIPEDFVQVADDTEESNQQSNSGSGGDGAFFIELSFNCEYRDVTTLPATYQRTGVGAPVLDLGTVEKWAERYSAELFSELREERRRVGGVVTASGEWFQPDAVPLADKQTNLEALRAQFLAEFRKGASGTLRYADFNQTIRVVDFNAELNRLQNSIAWSLTAHWTRFPNESDYSVCEFKAGTREHKTEGTVTKTLSGKIGAPTAILARAKLAALQAQLIPEGFVMTMDETDENRVEASSDASTTESGDGQAFIELSFTQEWTMHNGGVTKWELRITTADDAKTGWLRKTYGGHVQAEGPDLGTAFAVAAAQAAELGDGMGGMQIQSSVTQVDRQFLTSGSVFVTVEFSYEYQMRGTRTFVEVVSELTQDTFGHDTEQVSGYIAAPTLADALATYNTDVRGLADYATALLLNERKPTRSQQRLLDGATDIALDDRFAFSFTVYRSKSAVTCQFALEPVDNFTTLDVTTTVRGNVFAPDLATAQNFLTTLLAGYDLGVQTGQQTNQHFDSGAAVNGAAVEVFKSLEFVATFVDILSGPKGILESSITEEVEYAGTRWVSKAIPDGVNIMQNCGTQPGRRVVTVNAKGTTETSVQAYIRTVRTAMISGTYESPPKVTITFEFLPLTAGVARGGTANVKVFSGSAVFTETLPGAGFS